MAKSQTAKKNGIANKGKLSTKKEEKAAKIIEEVEESEEEEDDEVEMDNVEDEEDDDEVEVEEEDDDDESDDEVAEDDDDEEEEDEDDDDDEQEEEAKPKPQPKKNGTNVKQTPQPKVEPETDCMLIITNLAPYTDKFAIASYFTLFGFIEKITINMKTLNFEKGSINHMKVCDGTLRFETKEAARKAAQEMNGKLWNGSHINCRQGTSTYKKENGVQVSNMDVGVNEEDIWTTFEQCGDIETVKVDRDETKGNASASVYFKNKASVKSALELKFVFISNQEVDITEPGKTPIKRKAETQEISEMKKKARADSESETASPKKKGKMGKKKMQTAN